MNNEELVVLIQNGNKEYIPQLWDNVWKIIYKYCYKYCATHYRERIGAGVELEDMTQTSYFAFLKAVAAYKPEKGYKFTTYISHYLQNALNTLLGIRKNLGKRALNYAVSLDKTTFVGDNSPNDTIKIEIVEDMTATESFNAVERKIYNSELRGYINKALQKLPEKQEKTIRAVYLEGMTQADYAKQEQLTPQAIGVRLQCAFNNLRKDATLKSRCGIYREWEADKIDCYGYRSGFSFWKYTGYSSTEKAAEKLIQGRKKLIRS